MDGDGDGVDRCNNDCDDNDEFSYPGAAESESATDCMTDADSDGYGDTTPPSGGVSGTTGTALDTMNPFMSINYIIYAGAVNI